MGWTDEIKFNLLTKYIFQYDFFIQVFVCCNFSTDHILFLYSYYLILNTVPRLFYSRLAFLAPDEV